MAERRMFAKTIIDSDAFLDMPISAQVLYFHLGMRADDDGFVNSPNKIVRIANATSEDMDILIQKKFIIPFYASGIVVIKHWKINNYIRPDIYHETKYKEEKASLDYDENGSYTTKKDGALRTRNEHVTGSSTEVRIGKDRLGEVSKGQDKEIINPGFSITPELQQAAAESLDRKLQEYRERKKQA